MSDTFTEQLAEAWPQECEMASEDVEAVEALAGAISRLVESLGPERTGFLLVGLGRRLVLTDL